MRRRGEELSGYLNCRGCGLEACLTGRRLVNYDETWPSEKSFPLEANCTMSVVLAPNFDSYLISASFALAIRA